MRNPVYSAYAWTLSCLQMDRATGWLSAGLLLSLIIGVTGRSVALGRANRCAAPTQSAAATVAQLPSFEVASIKPSRSRDDRFLISIDPGRFTARGTVRKLIAFAYDVRAEDQVIGGPKWINSETYDVEAKIDDAHVGEDKSLTPMQRRDQLRLMLQSLLTDRLMLRVTRTTRNMPIYALVIARNGPKLKAMINSTTTGSHLPPGAFRIDSGKFISNGVSLGLLASVLGSQPELRGRQVLDETGLKGRYVIDLEWASEDLDRTTAPVDIQTPVDGPGTVSLPEAPRSSIFTALQEQLGLKLKPRKGPVDILLIKSIRRPSEN